MCVCHCIILIIKYGKCCFMSVFDRESPTTTTTSYPFPQFMYITFPGARFMQILICIAPLKVLSAGWNPLKPIVSAALHQILVVTFFLVIYVILPSLSVFDVCRRSANNRESSAKVSVRKCCF